MRHTEPGLRLLALIALALVFVFYHPGADPGVTQSVLLPGLALAAAWYLTGSLVAVAFAVMLLAIAHSDRGSEELAAAVIYPAVATVAGVVLVAALLLRFRRAMLARRAQRQATRDAEQ